MKIPTPRKLKSGTWFIQLRLGGESVPVNARTKTECVQKAQLIKAEYKAGKRAACRTDRTLSEDIDAYIADKGNILSPSTIRGYRMIQKHRFQSVMSRPAAKIRPEEWQSIVNAEAALCAPKTLRNALAFIRTVAAKESSIIIPDVTLPLVAPKERPFLQPEEIKLFIQAIKGSKYELTALLGLSSLRLSEIAALQWENIDPDPKFIQVRGAVVRGNAGYTRKEQNKNTSSTRNVPILIPELSKAIERDRKPYGPVMEVSQNAMREYLKRTCRAAGITVITPHGLRHSFASLAYHLNIPERIVMDMGGWSDFQTMRKIYTHIAQSDISRYQGEMEKFYKNAN